MENIAIMGSTKFKKYLEEIARIKENNTKIIPVVETFNNKNSYER